MLATENNDVDVQFFEKDHVTTQHRFLIGKCRVFGAPKGARGFARALAIIDNNAGAITNTYREFGVLPILYGTEDRLTRPILPFGFLAAVV